MRLLNSAIFIGLWLALFFWGSDLDAQTYGNAPAWRQSIAGGADNQSCGGTVFPANLASGSLIVGAIAWYPNPATDPVTTTVGGTLQSYTNTSTICNANTSGSNSTCEQFFYKLSSSSGAETLSDSNGIENSDVCWIDAVEVSIPVAYALDVSPVQTTFGTGTFTATTSLTTANNGGLVFSEIAGGKGNIILHGTSPPAEVATGGNSGISALLAGAAGSTSISNLVENASTAGQQIAMAFKPSGNFITASALPDGCTCSTYSAMLKDIGGSSAPTWSVTIGSLPSGLSLNSSSGAITGTPSATGTSSFTVSDGTVTAALSIKIDSSFATPTIKSFVTSVAQTWTISGVAGGDLLLLSASAFDSGAFSAYLELTSGLADTCSTTLHRVQGLFGGTTPAVIWYAGTVPTSCGHDTLTYTTTGPGSLLGSTLFDISGGQSVIDPAVGGITVGDSSTSVTMTSNNYTAPVPNELLISGAGARVGNTSTWSYSGAFTNLTNATFGLVSFATAWATDAVTSTGSYSATVNGTNMPQGGGNAGWRVQNMSVIGIRPGAPSSALSFLGERRHHAIH